jgi:periplasmic divalent cation tolerance protein
MMREVVFLYTTWPDPEKASAAGEAALGAGLAACVNILEPMQSIYRWQGRIERARETAMTLKTTAEVAPALRRLLVEHHPYDTPCIVALPVVAELSHPAFLAWVKDETGATASFKGDAD